MKITVTNINVSERNPDTVFFDVLLQLDEKTSRLALILQGWRFTDGKMYPPQKRSGRSFFQTVLCSPGFAKSVQEAAVAAGIDKLTEVDSYSWVTAKWGQAMIASTMPESPEFAKDLWEYYREKEN